MLEYLEIGASSQTGGSRGDVRADTLPASEARTLAALHIEQIPESLITAFGPSGVELYYAYAATSPYEHLVVCRSAEGVVIGGCLTSFASHNLAGRAIRARLWRRAWRVPFSIVFREKMTAHLKRKRENSDAVSPNDRAAQAQVDDKACPELLQLFVDPTITGGGIGGRMVERTEHHVATSDAPGLRVRTQDRPDNRAIRFYAKQGFSRIGAHWSGEKRLAVFFKPHASLRSVR